MRWRSRARRAGCRRRSGSSRRGRVRKRQSGCRCPQSFGSCAAITTCLRRPSASKTSASSKVRTENLSTTFSTRRTTLRSPTSSPKRSVRSPPTPMPVSTSRSPAGARRWGFTSAMRCRCSGASRIGCRMCWCRRHSSSSAFFYPRPAAADAQVHLGTIPFVRLRQELPHHLLQGRTPFSEAVAEAQKALPPPVLDLDPATRTVTAGSESFAMEPAQFAFYWMMAARCAARRGGVQRGDPGLGEELLAFLRLLGDISEQTAKAYRNFNEENFDPAKTKVNAALKRKLGARRATPYLIGRTPARFLVRAFIDSGSGCGPRRSRSPQACGPGASPRPRVDNRP